MEPRLSRLERDVLGELSPTEWKTIAEITDRIQELRRQRGDRKVLVWIFSIFYGRKQAEEILLRSAPSIQLVLGHFVLARKWALVRVRPGPPENRPLEYKLTSDGHRKRAELPRKAEHDIGRLIPSEI